MRKWHRIGTRLDPIGAWPASSTGAIRAAGGVIWRPDAGTTEVCLVHRPRYDDWSLPKGKLDPGEHPILAAVREVAEEADVHAVPQVRLPSVRYVSQGRPKVVDYWSMRAVGTGGFQPDTEVDEVRWLPVAEALRLVSYPHDAGVLEAFAALPTVTATLALVRHGEAGRRGTWSGPDAARQLDQTGWTQARALALLVALIRPARLLTATPRRCVQTFEPLAELLDLPIEATRDFDEPAPGQQPEERALAAAARLTELAGAGQPAAVCGQGAVIRDALCQLARTADPDRTATPGGAPTSNPMLPAEYPTAKGGGWLLAFAGERLLAADPLTDGCR